MQNNKYLPSLVAGFGAAVLSTIPFLKALNFCLIVPLGSTLAIILLDKSQNGKIIINLKKAAILGLLTGIVTAVFSTSLDVLITFITKTNEFVETLPQTELMMQQLELGAFYTNSIGLIKSMAAEIQQTGFSPVYTIALLSGNILVDSVFGLLGGLFGLSIINKQKI